MAISQPSATGGQLRRLLWRLTGALACLALTVSMGCELVPKHALPRNRAQPNPPPAAVATVIVKPGDTLYSLAWRHGMDFHELAKLNGIGPD